VAGFYAVRDSAAALQRCLPCPVNTSRASTQPDTACQACPPYAYTVAPGSAYCYCVPGAYPNGTYGGVCVPCEPGFYCDGDQRLACPTNSVSPPGAASRADCVCDPSGGYYGDLSLAEGVCLLRPPGGLNSSSIGCAPGWKAAVTTVAPATGQTILQRCVSGCVAGQYAQLVAHSQVLQGCVPCPPDTYSADGFLVDACAPCPVGKGTWGRSGARSPDDCACLVGVANTNTSCTGCPADQYFDPVSKVCSACLPGWVAPANSIGVSACGCPAGARALGTVCTPCPLNTYSHHVGLTCAPCPKGCITQVTGATSLLQCHCG